MDFESMVFELKEHEKKIEAARLAAPFFDETIVSRGFVAIPPDRFGRILDEIRLRWDHNPPKFVDEEGANHHDLSDLRIADEVRRWLDGVLESERSARGDSSPRYWASVGRVLLTPNGPVRAEGQLGMFVVDEHGDVICKASRDVICKASADQPGRPLAFWIPIH